MDQRFHALPREGLLLLTCERHLAELDATEADRVELVEALKHG
jgi:hypothetical protein